MKTIIMIVALAFSFMPGRNFEAKPVTTSQPTINYYWFDTNGTYLRQNQILTEAYLTGFDNSPNSPKTLQELGYNPNACSGNPPEPNDPESPDQKLYSHP